MHRHFAGTSPDISGWKPSVSPRLEDPEFSISIFMDETNFQRCFLLTVFSFTQGCQTFHKKSNGLVAPNVGYEVLLEIYGNQIHGMASMVYNMQGGNMFLGNHPLY